MFGGKNNARHFGEKDIQIRELSDTTANRSNLGNVSNIRDPRYSQEFGSPRNKKLKLKSQFKGIKDQTSIKIPKVKAENEGFPVHEEKDEMVEDGAAKAQAPSVVAIKTSVTSGRSKIAHETKEPEQRSPTGGQGVFQDTPS